MNNTFFIGFDFSINKPAATILAPNNEYYFFAWPISLTNNANEAYASLKSEYINVYNRDLDAVSDADVSELNRLHTLRSVNLANKIISDIEKFISTHSENAPLKIYIATEGLSYGSRGNVMLDLATYKGVFLGKIYETFKSNLAGLYTYSPITIKSIAGAAGKNNVHSKTPMIDAFLREPDNMFKLVLKDTTLKNKNNKYFACVDDIVDSYFVLKTMMIKQDLYYLMNTK